MHLLISDHTVPFEKADKFPKKVIDPTPQYATDGDPAQGIPATILTSVHYNSLMAEITNAILAGGLSLDSQNWGQLASIITNIIGNIHNIDARLNNVKEVGRDTGGVYVIVTQTGKDDEKIYLLTPSDLSDIYSRLWSLELSVSDIVNTKLPAKAEINGNKGQNFNANQLNVGGVGIGGTGNVGTSDTLWVFSPQAFDSGEKKYRIAVLNLIYAGADVADEQPANARQIIQISADRSQYTTGDIRSNDNQSIIKTRSVNLFANCNVYGNSYFQNGVKGQPADLSENYKSDRIDYRPGQVMMRAVKKGSEVELCTNTNRVFGVISTKPFITMNGIDENGPDFERYVCITMVGRIPVLVEGPLTINDHIKATERGTAIASQDPSDTWLGWPIEPDDREELRLVECFVKAVI